ncbi:hypothetical protein BYT27DRAFT_7032389, partial [Phlegmacium glaucopus]
FDVLKQQADGILDEAKAELCNLAGNLELEELISQQDCDTDDDDDNKEGWVDERKEMTAMEKDELDESVGPLRLMLTKLRKAAFVIKNSTTIILPKWFSTLEDLGLSACMIPHDVSTCWNSTFDMLDFAIDYRAALDSITSDRDM